MTDPNNEIIIMGKCQAKYIRKVKKKKFSFIKLEDIYFCASCFYKVSDASVKSKCLPAVCLNDNMGIDRVTEQL